MIYQIKITLQQTSSPIWRRILLHKDTELLELHEIIQIAFGWEGYHLHCFEPRKTDGESLYRKNLQIGTENEEFIGFIGYDFDEQEQVLSDWLVKEKDKLMYVYDFGDDWRHEIVLEKILIPQVGMSYPHCIKALRTGMEEDSGGYVDEVENPDPQQLRASINLELEDFTDEPTLFSAAHTEQPQSAWHRLLQLTVEYSELAPWRWMYDNQVFAIQHPITGEFVYCSIMGAMGKEFGIATYNGQAGLRYLQSIFDESIESYDVLSKNSGMVLSLCDYNEVTRDDKDIVKREGFNFHGTDNWPMFRGFTPGYYPWFLTEEEVHRFIVILERTIEMSKRVAKGDILVPEFYDTEQVFAQIVKKEHGRTIWSDTYIPKFIESTIEEPSELLVSELDLQRLKLFRKRHNTPLEFGVFYAPAPIQEDESVRPRLPTILIAVDRKAGEIIFHEMHDLTNHREKYVQQFLIDLLNKLEAIPREIWMTPDEYLILKPIVDKLGISVLRVENLPIINHIKEDMYETFS